MAAKLPSHTTEDFKGAEQFTIDMPSSLGNDEIERPDLVVVTDADLNTPHVKEYNRITAFMEDIMEIVVHKSEDKYAPDPVSCGVNGVTKVIKRGQRVKLARKFVDALIQTSYRLDTIEYTDKAGLQQTKTEHTPVQNVTVQVFHDPAGEYGQQWMAHKLSTAY